MTKINLHIETGVVVVEVEHLADLIIYKGEVYQYDINFDYVWAGSSLTVDDTDIVDNS